MLEILFIRILNMSLTGSFVILAVLAMRLFLRKAPKIFSYCLWAVVLFRLLCPVSFSAVFSPFQVLESSGASHGRIEYISEDIVRPTVAPSQGAPLLQQETEQNVAIRKPEVKRTEIAVRVGAWIWLLGMGILLSYSGVSLLVLKTKLKGARWEQDNIYSAENITTPFVIGFLKPKIYLPDILEEREKSYILLHEQIHLMRRDHIVKMLAFCTLCLHWFNPLVWAAFFLSEKDMEMSCDESVIRKIGSDVKKDYSASLLRMATGKRVINGVPLAFGEGETGSRIKNVLRYRKPAVFAASIVAVLCAAVGVILLANPRSSEVVDKDAGAGEVYYGVVADRNVEGNDERLLVIPGLGEVEIPLAEKVYTYFEREEQELLPGDMVQITFSKGEEVSVQETWPASFSVSAESIAVMWQSCALQYIEGDSYRFTFPGGVVPEVSAVETGDLLSVYWEENEEEAYLPQLPESENAEFLAATPIVAIGESEDGVKVLTVQLSLAEVRDIMAGFGFHIRFELETNEKKNDGMSTEAVDPAESNAQSEAAARTDSSMQSDPAGQTDLSKQAETTASYGGETDGTYMVSARSVERSAKTIDRYVADISSYDGGEALAFAENCVYKVNYSMDGISYEEVSFDTFTDLIGEGELWLNKPCRLTFQDGLIVEAVLESAYGDYGITFDRFAPQDYFYDYLMEEGYKELSEESGEKAFETYYSLVSAEYADIADSAGSEIIEVYTGNIGDGDSAIVMFKDAEGNLLCTQAAHTARAGWNNIYLGETEDGEFLMNVYVEDRLDYGGYGYWVYRLDEAGGIRQIAGSRFDFQAGGSLLQYDDDLFREWVERMTSWLQDCYLILSSQDGEIRTEKISEADKYNYDTLNLKERGF